MNSCMMRGGTDGTGASPEFMEELKDCDPYEIRAISEYLKETKDSAGNAEQKTKSGTGHPDRRKIIVFHR